MYTKEDCISALQEARSDLGETPSMGQYDEYRGDSQPSAVTIRRKFGKWNDAVREAGLEPNRVRGYTKPQLLNHLRKKAEELGHPPSINEIRHDPDSPAVKTILNKFDTWRSAIEAAGFDPRKTGPVEGASKGGLSTGEHSPHPASNDETADDS